MALSAELVKNARNSYYLCLRGHYYDSNFEYKTLVLSFKRFLNSEKLTEKINSFLHFEINKLKIANKIRSITTDNSELAIKATNNNQFGTRMSCFVHNLDLTILSALSLTNLNHINSIEYDVDFLNDRYYYDLIDDDLNDYSELQENDYESSEIVFTYIPPENEADNQNKIKQQVISDLIDKVRNIVQLIKSSRKLNEYISNEAKKENISLKLTLDMHLKWQSTHIMIDRFLKYTIIIENILINKPDSIEADIIEALKDLKLYVKDLILLKALNEVLLKFYDQSLILTSKIFVPISTSQLVISNLKRFLQDKSFHHTNSANTNEIKDIFYEKFLFFFEKSMLSQERILRLIGTYLNPLHYRYLTIRERNEVEKLLENFEASNQAKNSPNTQQPKSPDLINDMLDKIRVNQNNNDNTLIDRLSIKEELVYYVVRIKQNNLLSHNENVHKISMEKFWEVEKDSLLQLFSLFSQISIIPSSSMKTSDCFTINGYLKRKQMMTLYSKKLCLSKLLEQDL